MSKPLTVRRNMSTIAQYDVIYASTDTGDLLMRLFRPPEPSGHGIVMVHGGAWTTNDRTTPWVMVIICIFVNIGMWFERFVIVVTSLSRDFLPSSWAYFTPTPIDIMMLIGSFGLFLTLFTLFCRFLPVIAMSEVKGVIPHDEHEHQEEETH